MLLALEITERRKLSIRTSVCTSTVRAARSQQATMAFFQNRSSSTPSYNKNRNAVNKDIQDESVHRRLRKQMITPVNSEDDFTVITVTGKKGETNKSKITKEFLDSDDKETFQVKLEEDLLTAKMPIKRGKIKLGKKGINIHVRHLNHLRFADDVILTRNSSDELQQILQELRNSSMHLEKTKALTTEETVTNIDKHPTS
ncbi:hypothetical protein ILUMI_03571 [Ignelater luminosus]|uniref:Reverse transcriptase domain-containing protein n=1 Tax=Ignelater luminosus TaxID=2038154 RepID=A0A8K0DEA2_IGNLU|nr:hypothetical protein ILUMI_03571 [Ignelater luminosus]